MGERPRRPRLVGRATELAQLSGLLRTASGGTPSAAVIGGDAGVGKSRLLHEFLTGVPAGTQTLLGTCYDCSDPPVPFAPLLDAFGALPHDGSPAEIFEGALSLLARSGQDRPVVLAVDDLHLADRATLDLIAFLVTNLRTSRVLVLITWCSEWLPGAADLRHYVAELAGDRGADRIDLAPLLRADLADLLSDALRGPLDDATEAACWERSEGNPLFALELLAAAATEGRDGPFGPLPDTLADLMLARLSGMSPRARLVVRVVAAAGGRVDHGLLSAVVRLPADDLFAAVREAVDRQVLVPTDDGEGYRFRHELMYVAAYGQLLPGERRHLLGRHTDDLPGVPRAAGLPDGIPVPRRPRLTPRELQVLSLVASGVSNRTIAEELFISEKTAGVHVSNILAKLGARSRTAAAAAAHRLGVLR